MSRHRPPEPPDGVHPVGNRHSEPIPSVPELQDHRDKLLAHVFLRGLYRVDEGWDSIMRDLERCEQALDDARWRLACASWRWARWDERYREDYLERATWSGIALCQIWHWTGVFSFPGKALAVRPKTEVAR